jgi:serine/threonine-protein kinase
MKVIDTFIAAAQGLRAMHQMGYAHCDIKPNNILRSESGQVKVIDYGQSCRIGTIKERIQGTPDYIAPEQVARRPISVQTDVFNLGATSTGPPPAKSSPPSTRSTKRARTAS